MMETETQKGGERGRKSRILYFDPEYGGHHPIHILSLLRYWGKYSQDEIVVLLHPEFPKTHQVIWNEIKDLDLQLVKITHFTNEEIQAITRGSLLQQGFQRAKILNQYAKQYQVSVCYVNHLDIFLPQIAFRSRLMNNLCLAGIVFRPTLHYHLFKNTGSISLPEMSRRLQKRILLKLAVKSPSLGMIFSLDSYAALSLQKLSSNQKATFLPEPFLPPESHPKTSLWERLEVAPERKKFLLFGVLTERKGIFSILNALEQLDLEDQNKISLLFIGRLDPNIREKFLESVDQIRSHTQIRIHLEDDFISNQDAWDLFQKIDVVLAIYDRSFVGSSGLLVWAAYAQKPVLATSLGMIGRLVNDRQLGLTVDPDNPQEIAVGIKRFLNDRPIGLNRQSMKLFAEANSAETYSKTIIEILTEINQIRKNKQEYPHGRQ